MMSNTVELAEAPQEGTGVLPGESLRLARMEARLTQEDVARRLRLRVCIINDIENDSYKKMPELVFVRGYLRAYGQLLGLNSDELIEGFNHMNTKDEKANKILWQAHKQVSGKERLIRWLSVVSTIALLTWAALWWRSQGAVNHDTSINAIESTSSMIPAANINLAMSMVEEKASASGSEAAKEVKSSSLDRLKKQLLKSGEKEKEV